MKYLLLFLVTVVFAQTQENVKLVTINQGPVAGYKVPGLDVFAFYGIPYATAPTGTEKFKAPLPPPSWTKPFEAVDEFVVCPQNPTGGLSSATYREDCLVAHVYVPDTEETNLPVMVSVHGGAFQAGYANWGAPKELVNHKKNIIAVTFNYRLGPHGFLCLGTEDIPGNAGMKDQVTLLRWVQDNIVFFGGNPKDVTIAGCSAGGASVDLLQISKMTKGLFNKVIGQSGANVGAFAAQVDPTETARRYAKNINYDGADNIKDLEEFYKNISYEQLLSFSMNENKDVAVGFSPCLERNLGAETFLDDAPIDIIKNGDYIRYPMLYGYASMDGLLRIYNFEEWKDLMNEDFTPFLPADLKFDNEEHRQDVAQQIKEFYFGDRLVSGDTVQEYIDFNSDAMFVVAMHRSVTLQVESGNNNIYLHVFSFTDNNTALIPYTNTRGADHCAQADVVFDSLYETNITPEYQEMSNTMRDLWINFIYTGNPTPEGQTPASVPVWEPAGKDRSPIMHFDKTIQMTGPYEEERQQFWDDIYDKYHRAPVAPYDF